MLVLADRDASEVEALSGGLREQLSRLLPTFGYDS